IALTVIALTVVAATTISADTDCYTADGQTVKGWLISSSCGESDDRVSPMLALRLGVSRLGLRPGVVEIGRDLTCTVSLDDPRVSRRHARIVVEPDGAAAIEDLGSRNGTTLNGRALAPQARTPLTAGD